jgi:hypothetical protein
MISLSPGVMATVAARRLGFHRPKRSRNPEMNTFPILAAFTICVSLAILRASFDDLREAPLALDLSAEHKANEGLLDHELASADPIQAWLDRTLTPPADYFPPTD